MISSGQLTHVCEFVCQLELVSAYLSRPATLFCVGLPEKLFNLGGLSSSGLLHQSYDWIPELVEYSFENGRPLIFGVDRWRRGSLIDFSAQILVFIVVVCWECATRGTAGVVRVISGDRLSAPLTWANSPWPPLTASTPLIEMENFKMMFA
jgi:hypothetical protein